MPCATYRFKSRHVKTSNVACLPVRVGAGTRDVLVVLACCPQLLLECFYSVRASAGAGRGPQCLAPKKACISGVQSEVRPGTAVPVNSAGAADTNATAAVITSRLLKVVLNRQGASRSPASPPSRCPGLLRLPPVARAPCLPLCQCLLGPSGRQLGQCNSQGPAVTKENGGHTNGVASSHRAAEATADVGKDSRITAQNRWRACAPRAASMLSRDSAHPAPT